MGVFSFPAVAIFDSTATGRSLITAADQAAAQAAIGIDTSNYGLLDSDNTWSGDNTFTQTLTVNQIQNSLGSEGIKFDANYGYLTNANGASNVLRWGSNGFEPYQVFKPRYDETIDFGAINRRWVTGFFVNLDVKTNFSLFNLGETGDTNTEYLETTYNSTSNYFQINSAASGTGTVRDIRISRDGDEGIWIDQSGIRFIAANSSRFVVTGGEIRLYKYLRSMNSAATIGDSTYPFPAVYSDEVIVGDGDTGTATPAIGFNNSPNMGFARASINQMNWFVDANRKGINFGRENIGLTSNYAFGWRSSATLSSGTHDLTLHRDAAHTLAQRFGTNPQAFRIYGTWTDASNGAWLQMDYGVSSAGAATIQAYANGTGANGGLYLRSETSLRLYVGNILTQNITSTVDRFNVHIEPYFDNQKRAGSSTKRFTEVWSYDADLAGTLTVDLIQSGESLLKLNESASQFLNIWNAAGSTQYYSFRTNAFLPKVSSVQLGLPVSTARWQVVHAVGGSYDNLNVETGGSFKVYNLGDSHTNTTNTEYLEIEGDTSIGYYKIQPKYTGTGRTVQTLRMLAVQGSHISLYGGGQFVYTHAGVQHLYCNSGGVSITDLDISGTTTLRTFDDGAGNSSSVATENGSSDSFFLHRTWTGTSGGNSSWIGLKNDYNSTGTAASWIGLSPNTFRLEIGNGLRAVWQISGNQHRLNMNFYPFSDNAWQIGNFGATWTEVWQGAAKIRGSYVDSSNYGYLSIEPDGDDYLIKANSLGTTADSGITIQTSQLSAGGNQPITLDADYNGATYFLFGGNYRGYWSKDILQVNVQVATNTNFVINRTWNNAATVFQGFDANITDTASDANSNLLNLKVGGVQKFRVKKDGTVTANAFVGNGSGLTNLPAIDTGNDYTWTGTNTFEEDTTMESNVNFTSLPTSDPSVAGRLYNDSGTVKISAGGAPPP